MAFMNAVFGVSACNDKVIKLYAMAHDLQEQLSNVTRQHAKELLVEKEKVKTLEEEIKVLRALPPIVVAVESSL